ncbi:DUF1028 domain-containing protein [Oleomonas cavernae]|nr:DUF1028 domain-containing protein [Oleomonas cavernae]
MTFSLLARCASTGRMGIATATSSLAVGGRVPFALARAGAVATQNRTDPMIGPAALAALTQGAGAQAALDRAVAGTAFPEWRQVAVIDAQGRIATYHGERCSGIHAEARGEGAVALGNILATPAVPQAVIDAFMVAGGSLEERLVAGLMGGLAAGGEFKPLRSAALLVVDADPFPYANLRIDMAEAPLERLRELVPAWAGEAEKCRKWALDPDNA